MDPFWGKLATFANLLIYVLIRWPHGNRLKSLTVNDDRRGRLEFWLLFGAGMGTTLLPMIWVTTGFPSAADYPLHPIVFAAGLVALVWGNWLFYRAHADLGLYWSPTLQLREEHALVTTGIFRSIRHPMYTAMFVQGFAQLFLLCNWLIGPLWLVSFGALYVMRVGHEEQMMRDRFGAEYEDYAARTGRLWPGRER